MDDNDRVVKLARERGLDVEKWHSGAGVYNVVLIVQRDQAGQPVLWVWGSDCTFTDTFSFHMLESDTQVGLIDDDSYWGGYDSPPPTDDTERVVEYIQTVFSIIERDGFDQIVTSADGWGWNVYDIEEKEG